MFESLKTRIAEALGWPAPDNTEVRRAIADMARPSTRPTHPLLTAAMKDLTELKQRTAALDESEQLTRPSQPLKINGAFALGPSQTNYKSEGDILGRPIDVSISSHDLMKPAKYSLLGKPSSTPIVGLNFPTYLSLRGF